MALNTNITEATPQQVWTKPELSIISIADSTLGGAGDVTDGGGGSKSS